jgi:hypothetical protein
MAQVFERVEPALTQVENELAPNFPEPVCTSSRDRMLEHRRQFLQGLEALETG